MNKILFSIAMLGLFATPAIAQEMPIGEGEMPEKKAEGEVPAGAKEASKQGEKEAKRAERKKRAERQRGGDRIASYFKRLDKDQDGKISKEEGGKRMAANFAKYDKDEDGFVTKEELAKGLAAGSERGAEGNRGNRAGNTGVAVMKMLDVDGDGKISKDEAPKRIVDAFEKWDADKDGFVTSVELAAGMREYAGQGERKRGDDAKGRRVRSDKAEKENAEGESSEEKKEERYTGPSKRDIEKGRTSGRDVFGNMDTNGDGQISKAEAKGPLLENFAEYDKDGDGQLTKQELKGMRKPKGMGDADTKSNPEQAEKRKKRMAERKAKRDIEKKTEE